MKNYFLLLWLLLTGCLLDVPTNPYTDFENPPLLTSYTLLIFKRELIGELWKTKADTTFRLASFPVYGERPAAGVRLQSGSVQYPEGIYRLKNHNDTLFFTFPNAFDSIKAVADARVLKTEYFVLYPSMTTKNQIFIAPTISSYLTQTNAFQYPIYVVVLPNDIRGGKGFVACKNCPTWTTELYGTLHLKLKQFTN